MKKIKCKCLDLVHRSVFKLLTKCTLNIEISLLAFCRFTSCPQSNSDPTGHEQGTSAGHPPGVWHWIPQILWGSWAGPPRSLTHPADAWSHWDLDNLQHLGLSVVLLEPFLNSFCSVEGDNVLGTLSWKGMPKQSRNRGNTKENKNFCLKLP